MEKINTADGCKNAHKWDTYSGKYLGSVTYCKYCGCVKQITDQTMIEKSDER